MKQILELIHDFNQHTDNNGLMYIHNGVCNHRGKCEIHHSQNIRDLSEYLKADDHFYFAETIADTHMLKYAALYS